MEVDAEQRAARDEEPGRSDDDAGDHDGNGAEESGEEESGAARSVEELISKLESNDEWPENEMKLETVMLPVLLRHIERFKRSLQGNTQITKVYIEVGSFFHDEVELSQEDFEILGQVFAGLESLEKVTLETWDASRRCFENLTAAAAFVKQTTQIQCLLLSVMTSADRSLGQTEHGLDTRGYAAALSHLQALNSIQLSDLTPNESGFIVKALNSVPNLESVDLSSSDSGTVLDDNILQQVLQLVSLRCLSLDGYVLSKRNLLTISDVLSSGLRLTGLSFYACQLPADGCDSLSVALKHNNTLEVLQFCCCVPGDAFFRKLKDSLPENKSLKCLWVMDVLSQQSAIDLTTTVRGNYSLEEVGFFSSANCIDAHQASILKCIPRLNQAGRRYMVEGPTSPEKGLNILMKVKEDLDCLFLHLQENPSLCTEMLRRVADGKRKAVAIGQDDEVPCASKKRCMESRDTELSK